MSSTLYTTEFFTEEHAKLLGDMPADVYHALAAKYTTTVQPKIIHVASPTLEEEMKSALEQGDMVSVDGVMHQTTDGDMEKREEFETLVNCVNKVTAGMEGKKYIHILGFNITAYPHPKLLKALEEGKYTLKGGFWPAGQQMPEETIVAEGGKRKTNLMCSVYSNFNEIKTKGITARNLGCNPDIVPNVAMDVEFQSAEHAIQLAKAQAAVGFPEKYMDLEASDATLEKAMNGLNSLKGTPTLKRKAEKAELIAEHCNEVYVLLSTEKDFKKQKKAGQLPLLKGAWFPLVQGTAIVECSDFNKSNLPKLGANSIMQAFVILLRVFGGDKALYDRLLFDIVSNNVPVESAMHDPVKAEKPAEGASKFLFSGLFPDRVWGKVCGCPRYVSQPDGLVHSDGKPQTGHLGNGAELVRQAIKGDQDVLDFFGLQAPLTEDNMKAAAAAALNKFWEMAR
jgi:hypothetical protein